MAQRRAQAGQRRPAGQQRTRSAARRSEPADQILVHRVGIWWRVSGLGLDERFDGLDAAVERALAVFRERRTVSVFIQPPVAW
jgi:hypothetical protein